MKEAREMFKGLGQEHLTNPQGNKCLIVIAAMQSSYMQMPTLSNKVNSFILMLQIKKLGFKCLPGPGLYSLLGKR